jgi:hypothetical protein
MKRMLAAIRVSPEERHAECAERCLELLCDPERAPAMRLGEHEEAAIEAERRRWEGYGSRTSGTNRTSSISSR